MTQTDQKHHDEMAASDPMGSAERLVSSHSSVRVRVRHQHRATPDPLNERVSGCPNLSEACSSDPRHAFLDARAVMQRYGWGKTRGYQNLKNRQLVPAPVMTHPDRWRLDQLLGWEDQRIAAANGGDDRPELRSLPLGARLPGPKRARRTSA